MNSAWKFERLERLATGSSNKTLVAGRPDFKRLGGPASFPSGRAGPRPRTGPARSGPGPGPGRSYSHGLFINSSCSPRIYSIDSCGIGCRRRRISPRAAGPGDEPSVTPFGDEAAKRGDGPRRSSDRPALIVLPSFFRAHRCVRTCRPVGVASR
jgi:hypothetical protein